MNRLARLLAAGAEHKDHRVRPVRHRHVDRHVVRDPTIHDLRPSDDLRREEPRHGDARHDRVEQGPFPPVERLAGLKVRPGDDERDLQLLEPAHRKVPFKKSPKGTTVIEAVGPDELPEELAIESEEVAAPQALPESRKGVRGNARRNGCAIDRADGRPDYEVNGDAEFHHRAVKTDLDRPPATTAAEHERCHRMPRVPRWTGTASDCWDPEPGTGVSRAVTAAP